jgi:hypothetical protein
MNRNKNIFKFIFFLILVPAINYGQYFVGASAGVYNLNDEFKSEGKGGFNVRAGYIQPLNSKLGLGFGVEYARSSYSNSIGDFSSNTMLVDDVTSAFEYRVSATGYNEEQVLSSFQIPLFLQYTRPINAKINFYGRAGVKYMIPIKFEATATAQQVTATGKYPDFNLPITDLPSRGFGTKTGYSGKGEYNTNNLFLVNLELGISYNLDAKSAIYVGLFVETATNSLTDSENSTSFIGYNPKSVENRPLNGIYTSKASKDVIPFNFGLTLSYSFGL